MFVGDKCESCTNSNWDVRAKGYKDARNEGPSGTFDRGSSQQAWQHANYKTTLSQCKNPPQPFAIPSPGNAATATAAPPEPVLPLPPSIPGVLEAVQSWKVVWSWQGNNVDGPIAGENGTMLFANNDAGDVIQFDPATGLAKVAYGAINAAGAVSRSKDGALFVSAEDSEAASSSSNRSAGCSRTRSTASRSMHRRRAERPHGRCSRRRVFLRHRREKQRGVLREPERRRGPLRETRPGANGIVLSPDEHTLYVTSGAVVYAFDVNPTAR